MSNVETGSQELVILSYVIVFLHPSVSSKNEKNCHKISEDTIAVCKKTPARSTERELFGFELSVLQSISSHKNMLVPRHTCEMNLQTIYCALTQLYFNYCSLYGEYVINNLKTLYNQIRGRSKLDNWGADIHIYVLTCKHHKNNRFQKKIIVQNTNI